MADEVEIEPEFEDEDDFSNRLDELARKNQPDTTAPPTGAPPVEDVEIPAGTQKFTGKKKDKENKRLIERAQKEAERKRRQEQAEARRILREQQQDATREQRIQSREALRASRERVTAARSDAIAGRVQSYSLAASIGFPGYIAASIVDSLFIRHRENKAVNQERQYQTEVEKYNEQVRRDQIAEKRRREQEIRDMPLDTTEVDKLRGVPSPSPPPGTTPGFKPPPGTPPPGFKPPPGTPPPIPPIPPSSPSPPGGGALGALGALENAAIVAAAVIQTAQYVNQAIDKLADSITTVTTDIIKGNGIEASKGIVKTSQQITDPLGINIPLNVVVQSFDTLLDINKAILDSTRQNLAFAPKSLQADISVELQKLIQTMELTRKNDATTAELIKANGQLEFAWAEFRSTIIEDMGPTIIRLLQIMSAFVQATALGVDVGTGFLQGFGQQLAPGLMALLNTIAANTSKDVKDLDDSDIANQIESFFNPDNQRNKMRMNNTFPNR